MFYFIFFFFHVQKIINHTYSDDVMMYSDRFYDILKKRFQVNNPVRTW